MTDEATPQTQSTAPKRHQNIATEDGSLDTLARSMRSPRRCQFELWVSLVDPSYGKNTDEFE